MSREFESSCPTPLIFCHLYKGYRQKPCTYHILSLYNLQVAILHHFTCLKLEASQDRSWFPSRWNWSTQNAYAWTAPASWVRWCDSSTSQGTSGCSSEGIRLWQICKAPCHWSCHRIQNREVPAIFWLLKTSVFLIIFSLLPQDNTVNNRFGGKNGQTCFGL